MSFIRRFVAFWYDFIVGDDWFVAAGVLVLLSITAVLANVSVQAAWAVMPVGVVLILAVSLRRATTH